MPDGPADNPQQAELSSHIGGGGNCKCRSCLAGDDDGFHATEANYHQFYEVSFCCEILYLILTWYL